MIEALDAALRGALAGEGLVGDWCVQVEVLNVDDGMQLHTFRSGPAWKALGMVGAHEVDLRTEMSKEIA